MARQRKKYDLYDVFTPADQASLTYIERRNEKRFLERSLKTPGKQIVVFGHSGAGKTTLIQNTLEENKREFIVTSCMKGMTFDDILIDAFDRLDIFGEVERIICQENTLKSTLTADLKLLLAKREESRKKNNSETQKRAVNLPITPTALADFLGKKEKIWVIEDFHKMLEEEKVKLAQIMKMFMDMAKTYPKLKIIAVGAVNTAREVVKYDSEMRNRVAEIFVPLMSRNELGDILEVGANHLNIRFSADVKEKIVRYSSGLGAVTHELALILCNYSNIDETQDRTVLVDNEFFNSAMHDYIGCRTDTLKSQYDQAILIDEDRKYENPEDLLSYMLSIKAEQFSIQDIEKEIVKRHKKYENKNLKLYVDELTSSERSEIIRFDKTVNKYSFSTPFIQVYSNIRLDINNKNRQTISHEELINNMQVNLKEFVSDIFENEEYIDELHIAGLEEVLFN